MLGLMLFANFIFIYGLGLLWLNTLHYEEWLNGTPVLGLGPYEGRSILALLMVGMIPYIIGDIIKATAAALLTKGISPKEAYNGEIDSRRKWRTP